MLLLHVRGECSLLLELLLTHLAFVDISTLFEMRFKIFKFYIWRVDQFDFLNTSNCYSPIYRTLHFGQKYLTFPLKSTPRVSASRVSSSCSLEWYMELSTRSSVSTGTWLIVGRFSRSSWLNLSRSETVENVKLLFEFNHCCAISVKSIQRFFFFKLIIK